MRLGVGQEPWGSGPPTALRAPRSPAGLSPGDPCRLHAVDRPLHVVYANQPSTFLTAGCILLLDHSMWSDKQPSAFLTDGLEVFSWFACICVLWVDIGQSLLVQSAAAEKVSCTQSYVCPQSWLMTSLAGREEGHK